MNPQQMAMPAQMAAPGPSPDEMAIFEQMREQISPQEFTNEMLAGAEQVDPQTVAQFKQGLEGLSLPMEILDAINDLMDEVLENPADYQELRSYYISEGVPEDLLPEQFDPEFFAAFNMAVDQMLAEPTGVQAFAKGGIAELKPIAKAIASYGRDGDTMLAHITPAEARMLRRRGGSGTINPDTGLPEFKKWYKKLGDAVTKPFKAVAKAVKSVVSKVAKEVKRFAKSTVGKMVLTVALGFFLGPAAAHLLGVSSAAGVAAVGGFIGSAGSTLAAGGNLKDALKAGAVGGLTAGAGAGIMGGTGAFQAGSYTGPTTVGGQFDRFTDALGFGTRPPGDLAPVVDAPAPVPGAGADAASIGPGMAPTPQGVAPPDALGDFIQQNDAARMAANTPANLAPVETLAGTPNPNYTGLNRAGTGAAPTVRESFSKMGEGLGMGEGPASFDTFKKGATDLFAPGGPSSEQLNARTAELVGKTPGLPWNTALKQATNELAPGILRTYGPAAAAGLGIMGLAGGFQTKQPQLSETAQDLLDRDKDRPTIQERPDLFYLQNMPGVKYDERGAIIGSTPWSPSATMDDVRVPAQPSMGGAAPGMGMPQPFPPAMYTPAMGALGQQQQVAQPFNNPYMYSNLMQPRYAEGGEVQHLATGGLLRSIKSKFSQGLAEAQAQRQQQQVALQKQQEDLMARQARRAQSSPPALFNPQPMSGMAPPPMLGMDQEALMADRQARAARFAQGMQFSPSPVRRAEGGLAYLAQGGYPRRTGQISGPGTEKSDSIPAMLSDGEFVMTAKAVRGAGKGSRRAGAKKMYDLMHQLERNASRG